MNEDTIKVTQLPSAETITQNDLLMIVQNNENKKATSSQFVDMLDDELTNYYTKSETDDLLDAKANTEDLSAVATSGDYDDLSNKPTIPSISDEYGTSTTNGYSQNYINSNTLNPTGDAQTTQSDVSSATITNTLEAPLLMDLKGNTSQTGTPTPSSPIPVNVVSGDNQIVVSDGTDTTTYNIDLPVENLLNITNKTETINDVVCKYEDGTITLNGTCSSNGFFVLNLNTSLPSGNYSLSANNETTTSSDTIIRLDANNTGFQVRLNNANASYSGSYNATISTLSIRLNNGTQYSNFTFKPQLEKGLKVNSFTPYGTTPIELNKIGTYQDYIYKENDKWYLHKEVEKLVLDGANVSSSGIDTTQTNTTRAYLGKYTNAMVASYRTSGSLSNQLVNKDVWNGDDEGFYFTLSGTWVIVRGNKTLLGTTQQSIMDYFNANPLISYYPLATPTNTEITYTPLIEQLNTLEQAQSYEGTTNINQVNNDLPFILDITAFLDTYDGRYESLDSQIQNNKNDIQDNLVNVGTSVNSNYRTNMLYSHNLNTENYQIGVSWNLNANTSRASAFINVKPSTTYYIRVSNISGLTGSTPVYIRGKESASVASGSSASISISDNGDYTLTTTATDNVLAIQFMIASGTITQNDFAKVMITENDYQNYEPYLTPSINVDGEEIYSKPVVLWENANLTIDFTPGGYTLNDNLSNYKYYEVLFVLTKNATNIGYSTGKIPYNKITTLMTSRETNRVREITAITNTTITFGNAGTYQTYGGTPTTNNSIIIPYQILGYK